MSMNFKGKVHSISRDMDGNLVISFRAYDEKKALAELETVKAANTLSITASQPKVRRSLAANSYYWVLQGKLAGKLGISNARLHNLLLRRYGAVETVDGERLVVFIPDTETAENDVLEAETYHLKPTSAIKTFNDGHDRRMYVVLKGSSQYDTEEMSRLINGVVDECNQAGIPTATPDEISEMMRLYEKYHTKR